MYISIRPSSLSSNNNSHPFRTLDNQLLLLIREHVLEQEFRRIKTNCSGPKTLPIHLIRDRDRANPLHTQGMDDSTKDNSKQTMDSAAHSMVCILYRFPLFSIYLLRRRTSNSRPSSTRTGSRLRILLMLLSSPIREKSLISQERNE